jgi:response regulator RpfG family c-di-GMP phosphodiesterase
VRVLSLLRQKRLYDEIENQNKRIDNIKKAMLQSICKLSEFRDNDTNKHIIRVQEYTRLIAEQLSKTTEYDKYITEKYIEDISIASMLHDIGKIGISDAILLKPSKLTHSEFEAMKKHTTIGYHALEHIIEDADKESFITLAKVIAHTHHEKYDGTGYPEHLKGEEIPLSGRIVCLADVYDALTSERCYKKAIPHSQAIKHIEMEKYKFFDPFIVENFLDIEKQIEQVLTNYQDNSLLAV